VLRLGAAALVAVLAFPPWLEVRALSTAPVMVAGEYAAIFDPPKPQHATVGVTVGVTVDVTRLLIEVVAVLACVGVAYVARGTVHGTKATTRSGPTDGASP
jgi:hypothetical protein